MAATYKWLGESGDRRLVITNPTTKESYELPVEVGLAAIDANMAVRNTSGAVNRDEFLVAKVVADKNGRIDEIKTWASGGNRSTLIADLNAKLGERDAKLAELEAKLAAAGLA